MKRFVKLADEQTWVNLLRVDAIVIRPQLRAIGGGPGGNPLEDLHETTGAFEVVVSFEGRIGPVREFASLADAEAFVLHTVEQLNS